MEECKECSGRGCDKCVTPFQPDNVIRFRPGMAIGDEQSYVLASDYDLLHERWKGTDFPPLQIPRKKPIRDAVEAPELVVTEEDRVKAKRYTSLGHQEEHMPHSEIESMMAGLLAHQRERRDAYALLAAKDQEIAEIISERDQARNLVVSGDGSCDHCGAIPSIIMATSLCDECCDGVKRAETSEAALASLEASCAKVRVEALKSAIKEVVELKNPADFLYGSSETHAFRNGVDASITAILSLIPAETEGKPADG